MGISDSDLVSWSLGITAVAGALVIIWKAARRLARGVGRIHDFLEDWNGIPARAGQPARPSVPERLATLETAVQGLAERGPPGAAPRRGR